MTPPGTRMLHPDRRDAVMTRGALRIALVIDHPAQQLARALQLLSDTEIFGAARAEGRAGRGHGDGSCGSASRAS